MSRCFSTQRVKLLVIFLWGVFSEKPVVCWYYFFWQTGFWPVGLCLLPPPSLLPTTRRLCFRPCLFFGFPQKLDERWVSAQNRPQKLLVQIQVKGQIQECFLNFLNIAIWVFFNIFVIMHGSWWKKSGLFRWPGSTVTVRTIWCRYE